MESLPRPLLQKQNSFDICIFCALPEEADAVEEAVKHRYQVSFQQGFSQIDKYEYRFTTIHNNKQEKLTLLLSWLPSKGLVETAVHFRPLLQEFRPRFAAMTGICAGDKTKVSLGDLIVAECAYIYESGKVLLDREENGRKKYVCEARMYHPDPQTIQYARRFRGWEPVIKRLVPPLQGQAPPQCHIAPLASGNAVRSDSPFQEIALPAYKTAAIDMEGAAFYRVVSDFPETRALLVKGVCDYADEDKHDCYHTYAALISATYLLCFIHEYVTQETMPAMSSGEGRRNSFPVWNVPFLRNSLFTGREQVLSLLRERLTSTTAPAFTQPQALCGLGGIGKTQMATEYIYRHFDDYQQIFWANAATEHTLIADFVSIARQLDLLTDTEADRALLINTVKHWLAEHDQWLLILDNANSPDLVYDFLPGRYKGHVILTTQAQALGPLAQSIELGALDTEDARSLLFRRAKIVTPESELEHLTLEDDASARAIVARLGGFPLALDQAGAYIEETGCSFADYLAQLQQKEIILLKRRGTTSREHPASLATTWSLSFEKIEQSDPIAADMLRFCAFLAPDTIPQELLTADGASSASQLDLYPTTFCSHFDEAIAILRRFSLVRHNPHEKTLSLHRLVQVVLKAQMDRPLQRLWAERVVQAVNAVFPSPGEPVWSQGQRYLPHVQVCMTHLCDYALTPLEAPGLFHRAGRWLHEHAQYKEAEAFYLCACRLQEQQGDAGRPALAKTLDSLARLYLDLGMYHQGTPFGQRALALKQEVFGARHTEVGITLYILGRLSHAQVEYLQAKTFYQEALSLNKRGFGSESPETATTLHALAWLYHDQKFYAQAERLYQRALSIRQQRLGKNHASTAITLHQLAWLSHQQKRYAPAEALYQQALTMKEQVLGLKHPSTAITLHYFARLYHDQHSYEQAKELYQRALTIREQVYGPDHPFTAETLHYLAQLSQDQQCYEQAEELYQRALTIREQVYGPDHFITGITLHHFARLCETLRQYEQAGLFYQRTLMIRERSPGHIHPSTVAVAREYAHFLRLLQQESNAIGLEEAYCIT
jgi:tetratricopeptide (TPR) repeat protein/nucleoside phosphorylase